MLKIQFIPSTKGVGVFLHLSYKWIIIAKVVWRPPFEDIQGETRILEYESEDGARTVRVGERVGSRTFIGWN